MCILFCMFIAVLMPSNGLAYTCMPVCAVEDSLVVEADSSGVLANLNDSIDKIVTAVDSANLDRTGSND